MIWFSSPFLLVRSEIFWGYCKDIFGIVVAICVGVQSRMRGIMEKTFLAARTLFDDIIFCARED